MLAIEFQKSIPRYVAMRFLGRRVRGLYTSGLSPAKLRDIDPPALPTSKWVRIRPVLSGICGSDLGTLTAKGSAYFSPLTSTPFVLGHEIVGVVEEVGAEANGVDVGVRVTIHPALGCEVRGISPMCAACAGGRSALCRNVTRGDIAAGIQTGFCRSTGGGWSSSVVAHESQVYRVPDSMADRLAVLIEPFACALHGALRVRTTEADTVFVLGCGSIGLLTIAALRASGCRSRIVAAAKHAHQRAHALALGADEVVGHSRDVAARYASWAKALEADVYRPEIGKPTVIGGARAVFDCVATSESLDDSLRFTDAGGDMVVVGMPSIPQNVEWTTLWFKELRVHAAYAYGDEEIEGPGGPETVETFDYAIRLLSETTLPVSDIVGEPFALGSFRDALRTALYTGASQSVKTVFRID